MSGSSVVGPVTIHPVRGLPEIRVGDDLAALIAGAFPLLAGDVVVAAQKIISKAEGAVIHLEPGEDPVAARRRHALAGARRVVVSQPVLVVETQHGLVCANGGLDASNVPDGHLLALPNDPDASARKLRDDLLRTAGVEVAVVVSDTFGRPWRRGQTDVAIGSAGIAPVRDERGGVDREGRALEVTQAAVIDEIAGAADLVRRKADGAAVVVLRGLAFDAEDEGAGAAALVRPPDEDLFRHGRGSLADALSEPHHDKALLGGPPPNADLDRALAAAERAGGGMVTFTTLAAQPPGPTRIAVGAKVAGSAGLLAAGAATGTLLAALLDLDHVALMRAPQNAEPGLMVVAAARVQADRPQSETDPGVGR